MNNQEAQKAFAGYLNRRYKDRSTPQHYLSDTAIFFKIMNEKAVDEIEKEDIDSFVENQLAQGLSAATVNRRLAALHTFFEFLASLAPKEAKANPVQWRRHSPKQGQPIARDASDAEVEALFEQISDVRDQAIFGLMVGAGLRVGEVAQLKSQDLNPPTEPSGVARLIVCGKGQKERVVWLTSTWYRKVTDYQTVRPQSQNELLFLNHRGQAISVNGIQYRLRNYCREAGISITCHQLRHTFARRLANQKMPIEAISKLLGHNQIETTQRYTAGANPELQTEFEEAMSQLHASPPREAPQPELKPAVRPPRQQHPADRQELALAVARYAEFPFWLRHVLTAHLHRGWADWKAHMAAANAHRVARQMAATWQWLLQTFPITGWDDLCRTQIEQWMDEQLARGLAPSTVARNLSRLHSFLYFALDAGHALHPSLFRVTGPKRSDPLPRHLNEFQYQQLLRTVLNATSDDASGLLHRTWFLTLAFTGIRLSELLDLRLADLDLQTKRLFIHDAKNAEGRVIFLTPALVQQLQAYLAWRPSTDTDHLFLTAHGHPLSPAAIQYRCRLWGAACDLTLSPHRLRHTFATRLTNHGMPLDAIRRLLGHKTLSMTQRYARLHDSTLLHYFEAATAYLEGIPIPDWPLHNSSVLLTDSCSTHCN